MRQDEFTLSRQKALLATAIRNHAVSTGGIFSPWDGLGFYYDQTTLYRENGMPIASKNDLQGKSDNALWKLVMG